MSVGRYVKKRNSGQKIITNGYSKNAGAFQQPKRKKTVYVIYYTVWLKEKNVIISIPAEESGES